MIDLPSRIEKMSSGQSVFYWAGVAWMIFSVVVVAILVTGLTYLLWFVPRDLTFQHKLVFEAVGLGVCLVGLAAGVSSANHLFGLAKGRSCTAKEAAFHLIAVAAITAGGTAFLYNFFG